MGHDASLMTAIGDVLATDVQEPTTTGRRVWPRVLAASIGGFMLTVGIVAGALLAWDASYEGRVLPGVTVGGVDVSGLDRAAASAALTTAYAGYAEGTIVLRTSEGDVGVPFDAFARRADVDSMVLAALEAGRAGTPVERAVSQLRLAIAPISLEPGLTLDEDALAAAVTTAVARLDRSPIDSRITIDATGIHRTLARSGLTFDGATAAAAALDVVRRVDAPPEVIVAVASTETAPEHDGAETLAAQTAAMRMATDLTVTRGQLRWTIRGAMIRSWLRLENDADGRVWPVADEAAIAASFRKMVTDLQRDPVSARYLKTRGGRIVGVVAATNGRRLDSAATAAAIAAALEARGRGTPEVPVKAQVAAVEPKLTTAEAVKHGPQMVELGSWRTWFPISDRNYWGANIWRPAEIIDGTVLMPGQRFEWWSAIGPVSPARGYGPGGFIAGNRTEPTGALGGGMCSSSTTLFNAALRAGLQTGSRINHRYYIDRYPLGLDATVSKTRGGVQTMSFTNDMRNPIVIRSFRYREGGRGWVRYEIWGVPDGRTVSLSKPAVSNVRRATTKTVYVSTLPRGRREQVEYPANGMTVAVTRVVRSSGGRVLHRDTYRTNYALWNGIVNVGR